MSGKALIIAIEEYPKSRQLAKRLRGTNAAARKFFDWVTTRKKIASRQVWTCTNTALPATTHKFGTERKGILDGLYDLIDRGQDQTEELFVFFSGHGFSFEESAHELATKILVTSDFTSLGRSGDCCLKIDEICSRLFVYLGGLHHYFFVDACRTVINESVVEPSHLGITFPRRAQNGSPTRYMLFSSESGNVSFTDSGFSDRLVEGLNGRGRSKDYSDGKLFVTFPLVAKYVIDRVAGQKPTKDIRGDGEGLILEIKPVPKYTGKITIDGANPNDSFQLVLRMRTPPGFSQKERFRGPTHTFKYTPSDLTLEVVHKGKPLKLKEPASADPLDFFDDGVHAVFTKSVERKKPHDLMGTVRFSVPKRSIVSATRVNCRHPFTLELQSGQPARLPVGTYEVFLKDPHRKVADQLVDIHAGTETLTPLLPPGKTRRNIIQAVGAGDAKFGSVNFSETLDEMSDRDLSLWLTILGATRIIRDPTVFSKVGKLPLARFEDMREGEARMYVLAGFEERHEVSVRCDTLSEGTASSGAWQRMKRVESLDGVTQWVKPCSPGTFLLSLCVGSRESRTWATHCLPNRVTLAVFSEDGKGRRVFHQFVLPVFQLFDKLPYQVRGQLAVDQAPLRIIRTMHLAQNQFGNGRTVAPPTQEDKRTWDELLWGKYIDPVMSLLACYEMLRRGSAAERKTLKDTVVRNLEKFFPGLPDTTGIAKSIGLNRKRPVAPPLFLEGLAAFPDWEQNLPLPANRLMYDSVWTCWRGAVE